MRKNIVATLTLIGSIVFIASINLVLSVIKNPVPDVAFIQSNFALPVKDFAPETREKVQFLVSIGVFPLACTTFYLIFRHLLEKSWHSIKYFHLLLSITAVTFIFLLALLGTIITRNFYIGSGVLHTNLLLATLFSMVVVTLMLLWHQNNRYHLSAWQLYFLYFFIGICLILLLVVETMFNESEPYVPKFHFVAYFDSVVQTYLGKTLLVDNNAQYGLYSLLLKPLFRLIGLSVFKFTLVMGVLKGLAFLSLLGLLWHVTKNKVIAFFGFTTLAYFMRLRVPVDLTKDPFFQYMPHRFIFPASFLYFLWLYLDGNDDTRKRSLYYFISIFCAIAVLWNLDSGLVILLTWTMTLVYVEFLSVRATGIVATLTRSLRHLGVAVGSVILIWLGFSLYTYASSGSWPVVSGLLIYPILFYQYGYYMMPIIRLIHPWNLVALVYMVGIFVSIRFLFEMNKTPQQPRASNESIHIHVLVFTLSILGVGLFNYYIARSAESNLIGPSWPVILLLILYCDGVFNELSHIVRRNSIVLIPRLFLSSRWMYKMLLFLVTFVFLSSSILSVLDHITVYQSLIGVRLAGIRSGMPSFLAGEVEYIKKHVHDQDRVMIFSDYAPELYLYTNIRRALPVPGFGYDLVLKSDMDKVINFLENPPPNTKMFWDPTFTTVDLTQFENLMQTDRYGDNLLILYESKQ